MLFNRFSRSVPAPDPRAINHEEFEHAVKDGCGVVVDVREAHEFASAHPPKSLNMPRSTFDPQMLPSGNVVVLICHCGIRPLHALGKGMRLAATASSTTREASPAGVHAAARSRVDAS
jgi:hypothetical protein